jgi:hypothetical protein
MNSLLLVHDYNSYNDDLMSSWEEKGALCGFLYFEILFLERYKKLSFEQKNKIKIFLINEKKHIKQAEILLNKISIMTNK